MSTVLQKIESGRIGYLTDLLNGVDERWHSEFARFVETGEADDEFLNYLDQDKAAQQAVETAFKRQAAKFEEWAGELQRRQASGGVPSDRTQVAPVSTTSTMIAEVVEDALKATSAERKEVVAKSTAALAESMPAEEAIVVKEVAQSLDRSIAQVAETSRS